ncbi:EF-hand domain and EF-hand domain pair-containing protein [Strongyloides ratti]|uniref:EF-hand domain and EF-hand domain pair-containing protein n=1 Tax=Strongyloides ratti TaxID=34506 RepID=A0A090LD84_STRRB|nr:EF-hand domain and EF-hand domain pair-containing protein [Strongyloides ratti]CEF67726.1 EF-hand domain and EF-hand domain pair-containing protein [Strongyloides ratti]
METSYICERYILDDRQLEDVFHMLDLDNDGLLGRSEIGALLRQSNCESSSKELNYIFDEVDTNEHGKINENSFMSFMKPPKNQNITISQLEDKFDKFASKDESINIEDMKNIIKELDFQHDDDHLSNTFNAADTNKDGLINFHEFVLILRKIRFCC